MSEELDPLDEREAEQKEVADARLIEELSADDQLKQLQRILQDENVRDFLWRFLVTCNIYQTVANNNFGTMCLQEGRRQAGGTFGGREAFNLMAEGLHVKRIR